MPLPFDMLAVMLFLGWYAESPAPQPPPPGHALAIAGGAVVATLIVSMLLDYFARRALRRRGLPYAERRSIAAKADMALRVLLVGAYVATLYHSSLPWSLVAAWGLNPASDSFAVQALGLLPYVALFFAAWLPQFPLHRETNAGKWTRVSFLVHKARYNLYMLLAWLPFAFLADWLGEFLVLLPVLFIVAAWAFPLLLARAWGCRRLPEGPVMDTVRRLENEAGVKFSRVYLWEPGGGNTQNAAAVGIMRPFRYLFLTPALIRNMKEDELEGVILHELGHIKNKHLLFYLFTSLAGINLAVLLGAFIPLTSTERFIVTTVLVLAYFRLVFGWLSRNMERQADLFALEMSGDSRGLVNALEKLGISAGHVRLAESWHHLGIAERVDYLRRVERFPQIGDAHHLAVRRIMLAGYLASALFIGGMVWLIHIELAPMPPREQAPVGDIAHWRRVMRVVPDNPDAPLHLAYKLASLPEGKPEAAALASDAIRLAGPGEVTDAAESLLRDLRE
ncbi:MAG: M48 family metallopeptidase [Planctomycetaceae bacterium]|nr:M48 family metallopeptidase [Planctomycetaceae bacterium]